MPTLINKDRIATMAILGLILALFVQAVPAASSDTAMDQYMEIQMNLQVTTLTLITALSGEQLAGFGAGYVLPMDTLGDDLERQIVNIAEKIVPASYLEDIPAGSQRVLWLFPEFSVTFLAPSLEASGKTIDLGETNLTLSWHSFFYVASYPGDWRPQTSIMTTRDIWQAAATPETFSKTLDYKLPALPPLKNPPRIEDILSRSPEEPEAKVEWLRNQAFDLLAPIGERWLARDPDLPFTYADFAQGKTLDLDNASTSQKEWLKKLYTNHRSAMPSWEDLGKASVKLKVDYCPSIAVIQQVRDEKEISAVLRMPDSFSSREQMGCPTCGKKPLRFAENQAPPVYGNVPGKGMGWLLTR